MLSKLNDLWRGMRREYAVAICLVFGATCGTQATAQDGALDTTIRSHWVLPNDDGDLEGRISAIEMNSIVPIGKLQVSLVKDGVKKYTQQSNEDGEFTFADVEAGIYTLTAAGKNGFMAYGIEVLPPDNAPDGLFDELDLGNNSAREQAKQRYYAAKYRLPKGAVVQDKVQIDAAAIPPKYNTLQRITQNFLEASVSVSVDVKAIGKAEKVSGGFKYALSEDGSFKGRLQPIATQDGRRSKISNMNIFLIQDDDEKQRVEVKANGDFEIKNVEPGIYGIVAAGKEGFAALSLELVGAGDGDANASVNAGETSFRQVSSIRQLPLAAIGIAIVTNPKDIQFLKQEVQRVWNLQQPQLQDDFPFQGDDGLAGDGFPGGGFPGGSGFGGEGYSGAGPGLNGGSGGAPAANFAAPGGTFAPGGSGFPRGSIGGPARSGGGGLFGRLLVLGGLAGGIVAISQDDSQTVVPPPVSPSNTSGTNLSR